MVVMESAINLWNWGVAKRTEDVITDEEGARVRHISCRLGCWCEGSERTEGTVHRIILMAMKTGKGWIDVGKPDLAYEFLEISLARLEKLYAMLKQRSGQEADVNMHRIHVEKDLFKVLTYQAEATVAQKDFKMATLIIQRCKDMLLRQPKETVYLSILCYNFGVETYEEKIYEQSSFWLSQSYEIGKTDERYSSEKEMQAKVLRLLATVFMEWDCRLYQDKALSAIDLANKEYLHPAGVFLKMKILLTCAVPDNVISIALTEMLHHELPLEVYLNTAKLLLEHRRDCVGFDFIKMTCKHFESSPDLEKARILHIELLLQRGKELLAQQKIEDLITDHYTGKQLSPESLNHLHIILWDCAAKCFERKNYTEALQWYNYSLNFYASGCTEDKLAKLHRNRASCYMHLKQLTQAKEAVKEAESCDPDNIFTQFSLYKLAMLENSVLEATNAVTAMRKLAAQSETEGILKVQVCSSIDLLRLAAQIALKSGQQQLAITALESLVEQSQDKDQVFISLRGVLLTPDTGVDGNLFENDHTIFNQLLDLPMWLVFFNSESWQHICAAGGMLAIAVCFPHCPLRTYVEVLTGQCRKWVANASMQTAAQLSRWPPERGHTQPKHQYRHIPQRAVPTKPLRPEKTHQHDRNSHTSRYTDTYTKAQSQTQETPTKSPRPVHKQSQSNGQLTHSTHTFLTGTQEAKAATTCMPTTNIEAPGSTEDRTTMQAACGNRLLLTTYCSPNPREPGHRSIANTSSRFAPAPRTRSAPGHGRLRPTMVSTRPGSLEPKGASLKPFLVVFPTPFRIHRPQHLTEHSVQTTSMHQWHQGTQSPKTSRKAQQQADPSMKFLPYTTNSSHLPGTGATRKGKNIHDLQVNHQSGKPNRHTAACGVRSPRTTCSVHHTCSGTHEHFHPTIHQHQGAPRNTTAPRQQAVTVAFQHRPRLPPRSSWDPTEVRGHHVTSRLVSVTGPPLTQSKTQGCRIQTAAAGKSEGQARPPVVTPQPHDSRIDATAKLQHRPAGTISRRQAKVSNRTDPGSTRTQDPDMVGLSERKGVEARQNSYSRVEDTHKTLSEPVKKDTLSHEKCSSEADWFRKIAWNLAVQNQNSPRIMRECFILSYKLSLYCPCDKPVLVAQKSCLLMAAALDLEMARKATDHLEQDELLSHSLENIELCREIWRVLQSTGELAQDPTEILLLLYEFEARAKLNDPRLETVFESIWELPNLEIKTLETIASLAMETPAYYPSLCKRALQGVLSLHKKQDPQDVTRLSKCFHSLVQLSLSEGRMELEPCAQEEVWMYFQEALAFITSCEEYPEIEIIWLMTSAWNTGILLYSVKKWTDAERWCALAMKLLSYLRSLKDSYENQMVRLYSEILERLEKEKGVLPNEE
ncbi:testis-expressed protein 11 [Rhinophrynus dorsalis]